MKYTPAVYSTDKAMQNAGGPRTQRRQPRPAPRRSGTRAAMLALALKEG